MANVILGISPGTRQCGIAIIREEVLVDWRVTTFRHQWSVEKLENMLNHIEKIIIRQAVTEIACKVSSAFISSKQLDRFIKGIKNLAKEYKLPFYICTLQDLKNNGKEIIVNKEHLVIYLTQKYPELTHKFLRHQKNKNQYYLRLFEAVAAAMHCKNLQK